MILEAFARYLQSRPELHASAALRLWLAENLSQTPTCNVGRVLHAEIAMLSQDIGEPDSDFYLFFQGNSNSGSRLLVSLYEYSMSYEQQRWSRFVHKLKASDFGRSPEWI